MKLLKVIRQYEWHVFQGVPEKPELSFDTNDSGSVGQRSTGKPITSCANINLNNAILVGRLHEDFDNKTESFERLFNTASK